MYRKSIPIFDLIHLMNLPIRSKASASLLVSASGAELKFEAPKLLSNKARNKLSTTRLPITTVARKKGTQAPPVTSIQSHMDSIHSPHKTLNIIINEWPKSVKFQRGSSPPGNR